MSKKQQAQDIYNQMIIDGASNKDIEARFINELNMSKAGATTYRNNCKNNASGNISTPTSPKIQNNSPVRSQVTTVNHSSDDSTRDRIDPRPLFTACIVNDDIISATYSYYDKEDAFAKSTSVILTTSSKVPEVNTRWSQIDTKYVISVV